MDFDHDRNAHDGIWLHTNGEKGRIFIDFDYKKREFRLVAPDEILEKRKF